MARDRTGKNLLTLLSLRASVVGRNTDRGAGDLLVRRIRGMQFVLEDNEIPKRAAAFGGIFA
jgi:hypothetical protein